MSLLTAGKCYRAGQGRRLKQSISLGVVVYPRVVANGVGHATTPCTPINSSILACPSHNAGYHKLCRQSLDRPPLSFDHVPIYHSRVCHLQRGLLCAAVVRWARLWPRSSRLRPRSSSSVGTRRKGRRHARSRSIEISSSSCFGRSEREGTQGPWRSLSRPCWSLRTRRLRSALQWTASSSRPGRSRGGHAGSAAGEGSPLLLVQRRSPESTGRSGRSKFMEPRRSLLEQSPVERREQLESVLIEKDRGLS